MGSLWLGLILCVLAGLTIGSGAAYWLMRRRWQRQKRAIQFLRASAHRRARRLIARAQRAEQLAEIGTLTGGLAHEIKNPLSTIQLNLQLLMEDLDAKDPIQQRLLHRLTTVNREAGRLRDILDDFLRYAGKIELKKEPIDLNILLEQLVDFFAPQAQVNRVNLRFDRLSNPVTARVDQRLIKQAVLNLMLNAVQAMPNGGELILTCSGGNPQAMIDVIDTGPGISPAEQEKIFQAYYSTRKGGAGLGLAMTRRIVQEHGGQMGVRSEVGKGSDFFIRLPAD